MQGKRTASEAKDWRVVPRSEMFKRVIITVDSARGEAEALGDEATMRRCDEQLFPFLEAELERARKAERAGQ
jgi:hypothetical protein